VMSASFGAILINLALAGIMVAIIMQSERD
jgi:hypothetical protein